MIRANLAITIANGCIKMIGDIKEAELITIFYHERKFDGNNSIIFTVERLDSKKTSLTTVDETLFHIFTLKTKGHWKISKTIEDIFDTMYIRKFKSDSDAVIYLLKTKDEVQSQYDIIAKDILEKEK